MRVPRRSSVVDPLDVLRVLALYVLVFLCHSWAVTIAGDSPSVTTRHLDPVLLLRTPAWAGIWILFLISGYLAGVGFYSGRYAVTARGVAGYYWARLSRIVPSYLFLVFVVGFFIYPGFLRQGYVLLRLLTFTYKGLPGVPGIGATWYVSTVVQLYLVAPLVFVAVARLGKRASVDVFVLVLVTGLSMRVLAHARGVEWYTGVYTPFWMNLDLFICGMLSAGFTLGRRVDAWAPAAAWLRVVSVGLLAAVISVNSVLYWDSVAHPEFMYVYMYVLPSAYIIAAALFLVAFDAGRERHVSGVSLRSVAREPALLFAALSAVSFEFYLWHSNVLEATSALVPPASSPQVTHLLRTAAAATVAVGFAWVIHSLMKSPVGRLRRTALHAPRSKSLWGGFRDPDPPIRR